jgi:hypothetical protein
MDEIAEASIVRGQVGSKWLVCLRDETHEAVFGWFLYTLFWLVASASASASASNRSQLGKSP